MIAQMRPDLDARHWRFVLVDPANAPTLIASAIGTFREEEGVTAIVPSAVADQAELAGPDFCRIMLQVHSDLVGVGLTAAVSNVLADADIACNMVAAYHHDHVFVPCARAAEALALLQECSADARRA